MNRTAPSLAGRAVLALVLLAGFYLLALAVAGGLLYIPYAEWRYLETVTVKLALFCVVGAGIIVWSILPRPDRFDPPGPRLTPEAHPKLFAVLRSVASRAQQAMPSEVYAVAEMNAWVAQRGGVMGIGSRRVMGLGLPLMQVLTVREMEAVLAHEFGHYHGGDTALGPWIYKTRAAIERTLVGLAEHSALLTRPFVWYMKGFLRVTHAISRRQEFVADALAARVAGADAMASSLKVIHGAAHVFDPYWHTEFGPTLQRGYRPPLAGGFARFLRTSRVEGQVRESLERELAEGVADPYDTHPPLRERLAALPATPPREGPGEGEGAAIDLLGDVERVEAQLVAHLLPRAGKAPARMEPLEWDEATERVWLPSWREAVGSHPKLRGLTPAALADYAHEPDRVVVGLGVAATGAVLDEHRVEAGSLVGCALAVALHDAGFAVDASPGAEVTAEVHGTTVRPFAVLSDLASGEISADAWRALCQEAGIADRDLGAASPALVSAS